MSISTISVASPAVVSANAMVAPTFPAPRMAIFLPLFMGIPFFQSWSERCPLAFSGIVNRGRFSEPSRQPRKAS
jgi:hypothetical protein